MAAADDVVGPMAPVLTESMSSFVGGVIATLVAVAVTSARDGEWLSPVDLIVPALVLALLGASLYRDACRLRSAPPLPEAAELDSTSRTWMLSLAWLVAPVVAIAVLAGLIGGAAVIFVGGSVLLALLRLVYVRRLEERIDHRFFRERRFWTWDPHRFYRSGA